MALFGSCNGLRTPGALACNLERIVNIELWKQCKVAIRSQQHLDTMGNAKRRDAGVVHDSTTDPRTLDESLEHAQKVLGF